MTAPTTKTATNRASRLFFDRQLRWVLVAVVAVAAALWRTLPEAPAGELSGPADVRDGDSINIRSARIRLEGIDAPELGQSCGRPDAAWDCGRAAATHLARLFAGRRVTCAWRRRDRHGRYLARCTAGSDDLNALMVRNGMAVGFGGNYAREENAARAAGHGLWAGPFLRPDVWRRRHPRGDH
jgi:endonuclease YncB( thermonuclease family)